MKDRLKVDLGDCDIFNALSPLDQDRLSLLFRPRSFNKNEVIFLKGEPGYGLYLIRNGRVKICVVDHYGAELIFTFLSKGDFLGDMAILDGRPRSAKTDRRFDAAVVEEQTFRDFELEFVS